MTLGAFSGLGWSVVKVAGLVSVAVAVGAWLRSVSKAQRLGSSGKSCMGDLEATCRPESEAPASSSSSPPVRAKKKKKSVKFDLERNETVEVGYWYVEAWGTGDCSRSVRWGNKFVLTVDRYLEPYGHTQLHFPQTKWIHDVPSWDTENDDGDIDMIDS